MGKDLNDDGFQRHDIICEVEQSLKRLRTDRIDFYFAHHYDPLTPTEETLHAFDDLQRQGKILYPAFSDWAAWRIANALGISVCESLAHFELVQSMCSPEKRQTETELFPPAQHEQLGVIVYIPLASSLLIGLYGIERCPAGARLDQARYGRRYGDPREPGAHRVHVVAGGDLRIATRLMPSRPRGSSSASSGLGAMSAVFTGGGPRAGGVQGVRH